MRTKIIAAFPGTGKSHYHKLHPDTTLDSDSSLFSWIIDDNGNKVRNPEFPNNYIRHILDNVGKYEYIFVSTHREVRDALLNSCIYFYIVYPDRILKKEYINRYIERGSDEKFIGLLNNNWDTWLLELETMKEYGVVKIAIPDSKIHLSYVINFLKEQDK